MPRKPDIHATTTQLAHAFRCSGDVVGRRLREAGVEPVSKRGGAPVYSLSAATPLLALYAAPATEIDPARQPAHVQLALAKAASERLRYAQACGELVTLDDHRAALASLAKNFAWFAGALIDWVERDVGIDGRTATYLESRIDEFRTKLVEKWLSECNPTAGEEPNE